MVRVTRCLFVSDLHGRPDRYEKLLAAVEAERPGAVFLGGDWLVALSAAASAVTIDRLQLVLSRPRLPTFYLQVAGGAVATLWAVGLAAPPVDTGLSLVVTANIVMLLAGATSLRDVIAFPKSTAARALFEGAPTTVDAKDLAALHLEVTGEG